LEAHSMAQAILTCWREYGSFDFRRWAEQTHDVAETVRQSVDVFKRYVR